MKKKTILLGALFSIALAAVLVLAATGDLLGTVNLPGNAGVSVGGTFDGTYYMTTLAYNNQIDIYLPPAGGNSSATLVSNKSVVNESGSPVIISALAWDPSRNKLWGAYGSGVYLIDIGDPTVSGNAVATFMFDPNVPGIPLTDGLAYDASDDTLYHSPDVNCYVYQFSLGTGVNPPLGTMMNNITPKNANGTADCFVSGVVVGSSNTLYIGRNGFNEIRRIDKTTGDFISNFATTAGRVEDLTCDPITYYPKEAILAKDAYNGLYEAFEVEEGTCPLPDVEPPEVACVETTNPHGKKVPPAGSTTLPGPKGGQNEDGFYELLARDLIDPNVEVFVMDSGSGVIFGPFMSGDKVKITESDDEPPTMKKMGSNNGKAGAITTHLILNGDAIVLAVDNAGNMARTLCLVPKPPK
jgi:hypothetical protein